ncbi:MAG: fused MFS/spermidine synthase [Candidatus Eisenbacteria bacterium]|nr:fused MFS/spermidine synthase [Candidatus Eisenbacteria bacterium]
MNRRIIAVLFFLSGAAGLIYQVVWTRSLTLLFGSTTLAASTVLTSFMAGLALGSFLFGRFADTRRRALPVYALLEVGIAVTALLFPVFLGLFKPAYLALHRHLQGSYLLFPLARFLICFVWLVLPTALMGGTLPVITRFFVKERRSFGGNVSALYALNTFGAMIGCFGAGFFLIPGLGIAGVTLLAAGLNLIAAAGALILARSERAELPPAEIPREESAAGSETAFPLGPRTILILFALAGFASLAYEVLWTRALLVFLGWFAVYAFTIILTTFLFGIALGSAFYPLIFRSGRRLVIGFGVIEIAIGVFAALSVAIFGDLFELIRALDHHLGFPTWWRFIGARAGGSFAVVLLPTFLMGLAFPVASAIYARAGKGYGRTVGYVYSANTVGAILGSLLTGFLLLPTLGVSRSIAAISLINLAVGGIAFFLRYRRGGLRLLGAAVLLLAVGGGLLNFILSSGRPMILQSRHFKNPDKKMELLYANEGATASLAVLRDLDFGHNELNINGESTAYTTYTDMQVHLMLSHTPLLLAEDPRNVLVIGFGMGSTSWGAVLYPSVEEVVCVELVPKEVETAIYFRDVNHGVLEHPKFRLVIDDGRNHVFATRERYDLISFNAIHPSHSPALYTSDFYAECARKLSDRGVICAWVPTNSFTEHQFQILLKTFLSVFPHSSLWYVNPNHLVLIGTRRELRLDYAEFRRLAALPEVNRDLANYTMEDPFRLLAYHLMDEKDLDLYTRSVPVNSDDKPYLEYSREMYTRPEIVDAMLFHRSSILPYLVFEGDGEATADTLRRYEQAAFHLLAAQAVQWLEMPNPDKAGSTWKADQEFREAFRILPGDKNLEVIAAVTEKDEERLRALLSTEPMNLLAWDTLLRIQRMRRDWEGIARTLTELGTPVTDQARLCLGMLHLRSGEWDRAERAFRGLATGGESETLRRVGEEYLRIIEGERDASGRDTSPDEKTALAQRYWGVGDREHAEELFREAIERFPDRPLPLFAYAQALEESRRFARAESLYAIAASFPIKREDFRRLIDEGLERTRILVALERSPHRVTRIEGRGGEPIDVDPASPALRLRIAALLGARGMWAHAAVHLRLAVTIDPENADAHEALGGVLSLRGLVDAARSELKEAIRIDPNRRSAREKLRELEEEKAGA